jgi:hypothetical protein
LRSKPFTSQSPLCVSSTLKLHEFIGSKIPPYAILSHTWGEEEVSFQGLQSGNLNVAEKKGFDKIKKCCRIAAEDGFAFAWVDTCCINKTSSAEPSEAINSMFRWCQRAEVCYAYLADIPSNENPRREWPAFRTSRWFTRGWILQELIAPVHVTFLRCDWQEIGSRLSLQYLVPEITKVHLGALMGGYLDLLERCSENVVGLKSNNDKRRRYCVLFDGNF